jgi:hypothetical protein
MSRSFTVVGLPTELSNFLETLKREGVVSEIIGFGGEVVETLYSYSDKNGDIWVEEEDQENEFWSGGPYIFTQLRNLSTDQLKKWKIRKTNSGPVEWDYEKGIIYKF